MRFDGILLGALAFLVIGLFHPLVIWGEYYFSKRIWPAFLALGLVACALSLLAPLGLLLRGALGIVGFSSFWSILELRHQEERVRKGWFPKRPGRDLD